MYSLDVISHLPEFKNRKFKKHTINGIDSIGVYGNEPFSIQFKNNTYKKVQVRLSLDGTDILTGQPATTNVSGEMWMVNPYATLEVKAWPETSQRGAQFIFTSAGNSVAVNTHGNLSSQGIIAAAVFTEGYTPPNFINYDYYWGGGTPSYGLGDHFKCRGILGSSTISLCDTGAVATNSVSSASANYLSGSQNAVASDTFQKSAAVGAGQTIDQKIQKVSGLVQPSFSQIVKLRYQWWTELCEEAKAAGLYPSYPGNGFPGDEAPMMSIGSTPRLGTYIPPTPKPRVEFSRF